MAEFDYKYIGKLVDFACKGDSNAFAELYGVTYQKQYILSRSFLDDDFLAQDALQETYINALKNLNTLKNSKLFVPWLNQINFRVCCDIINHQRCISAEDKTFGETEFDVPGRAPVSIPKSNAITIDGNEYLLNQITTLQGSEPLVIFLHYFKNIKINEIAYILEVSKSTVKRFLSSGKKHLAETTKDKR